VASERQEFGGVNILLRGPQLAERKADWREDILKFGIRILKGKGGKEIKRFRGERSAEGDMASCADI
jgi:hypothetical protein